MRATVSDEVWNAWKSWASKVSAMLRADDQNETTENPKTPAEKAKRIERFGKTALAKFPTLTGYHVQTEIRSGGIAFDLHWS